MSSKEELYRVLIESAPYGTLFFVYGVCIEANSKAFEQLGCDKKQLIGTSLDEIIGDESSQLVDLKLQLKKAIQNTGNSFTWLPSGNSDELQVELLFVNDSEKEIVVTLTEKAAVQESVAQPPPGTLQEESTPDFAAAGQEPEQVTGQVTESIDAVAIEGEPSVGGSVTPPRSQETSPFAALAERLAAQTAAQKNSSESAQAIVPPLSQDGADLKPPNPLPVPERTSRDYYFDKLTGLPNRQLLLKKVGDFLEENRGKQVCGVLLVMGLDHFKDVNNSWGHPVGDKLLKKVGRKIAGTVTGDKVLARLSGDEFVLFVPKVAEDIADAAWEAQALAEQVRDLIATPLSLGGQEIYITASIGIALIHDSELNAEQALQLADTAAYEAKRKGRNSISFFNPSLTEKAHRDVSLSNRLRRALDHQEFVLFVQPQLSVETGEVLGGEVLLRWMSSDRVTSMPSEFIPLLEKSGLIVDVGRWVIRTSCEYLRNLIDDGLWKPHMRLGVNISPRQFHDPQLLDVIEHSVQSYGVDPRYLNFEITENLVIEDVDDAIVKMEQIKSMGSMFSIDDFGIGYSSMIYLKRLPLDHLKIDREFIRNINTDEDSRGVVEAIMAVSRQYGLEVTAEGVENGESLDVVRNLGCTAYQGAHYSMPVPYKQFKQMLLAA